MLPGTAATPRSGLLNTAHQLGMALGLGILVTASAHAGDQVAAQVSAALTGSSVLLAVALLVVLAVIVPARTTNGSA